jgi:hypothetical protein
MQPRASCLATLFLLLPCAFAQEKPRANQPPPTSAASAPEEKPSFAAAPASVEALLESQIKAEWEAIKKRDKAAFGKLLADDFIQVENDGDGARNRYKAANELMASFVTDYHLQLLKTYALAPTVTYVRYECTMEFPQRSAQRYKRMWISEIWVKQGADWKLWRYQETSVK